MQNGSTSLRARRLRECWRPAPDTQWRLIFALSRYGGLRCPSEHLALRWEDVDWDRARMLIRSSKTEHHEGGESRQIPLFPELLPYLRDAFEEAEAGAVYVITKYRDSNCNLRTQLLRIIKRAGLKPWPKLFQNLRATRQTELCERWPEHLVCAWIDNSRPVARKHYLQVSLHMPLGDNVSRGECWINPKTRKGRMVVRIVRPLLLKRPLPRRAGTANRRHVHRHSTRFFL